MSDTLTNALRDSAHSSSVLAGIANPAQINPLAGIGSAQQLVGRMQELDKSLAERQLGRALNKAVDPVTGRFDPLAAQKNIALDPDTAYAAKTGLESTQSLQGSQFQLANAQNAAANAAFAAALNGDDAGLAQRLGEQAGRLIDTGVIPRDRVIAGLLRFDTSDPVKLRQQLDTLHLQTLPPEKREGIIYGETTRQTGPGGVTVGIKTNPRTGVVTTPDQPGASLGLTVEQLNTPMTYQNKEGKTVNGTLGQRLQEMGVTTGMPPAGGATGGRGGPGMSTVDLGNGRRAAVPGALTRGGGTGGGPPAPAPAQGGTTPPAPPPAPGSGLGTPLPALQPGEPEVIRSRAEAASAAFDNDNKQGDAATGQLTTLGNIQSDIAKFTTGSGAGRTLDWKRAAQSWTPGLAKAFGITPTEVAGQEDFLKNVAQLQLAQGMSTDKRLDVIGHMTPQDNLSPEGVDLITRKLQGNADYLKARGKMARDFKGNRLTYDEFQSQIAELDPRVFQVQRMSKPQRDEYFASLNEDARREVFAARQKARDLKVLP